MSAGLAYTMGQTDDPENREVDDFYPTNPDATRALLSVEKFDGPVWEPACGEGDLSRVLIAAGYDVISTDLIGRGYGEYPRDFLMEWSPRAPNIVTNPPFREAQLFCERALQLTAGKVAMFLRLAFLETLERGAWFPTTPLARVWVMSRRVPMQRGRLSEAGDGHGMIAFAWFVWDHSHSGPPVLGWLDWKEGATPPARKPALRAAPEPPSEPDLCSLIQELRAVDLDVDLTEKLALRRTGRPRRSARSRKGWVTRRDRDGAEGGDANAAPVPQDRQARAEGIAQ